MINDDISPYNNFVTNQIITDEIASTHIETVAKYLNAKVCNNKYTNCTGGKGYKTITGNAGAHIDADAYIKKTILLNNGMTIWRGSLTYYRNRYYIDINGTAKGPNKLGYDLFTFEIDKQDKLIPEKNNANISKSCSFSNPAQSNSYIGFGCAYYALTDEHPEIAGKSYWKDFLK